MTLSFKLVATDRKTGAIIPPATKKTSQIATMKNGRHLILPSQRYQEWARAVLRLGPDLRRQIEAAGYQLPIKHPVEVTALFFRERNIGDLLGYEQALADILQAPRTIIKPDGSVKTTRRGLGIIDDDRLIVSWDGSRPQKDPARPRVEVTIRTLGPEQLTL